MSAPAPLYAIKGAPTPEGGVAEWLTASDGVRVRAALFKPPGGLAAARGSVVVSPGRGEAIEKYFEVIGELQARRFAVLIHDWRGQGLSDRLLADRLKGHAKGWRPFLSDLAMLLAQVGARAPRPWIALGHSMGGALTLLALTEGEDRFAAVVLSAPMLGLVTPGVSSRVVRLLSFLAAGLGFGAAYAQNRSRRSAAMAFVGNLLTHDADRWGRVRALSEAAPDLRVGDPTWGWVAFATSAIARLSRPGGIEAIAVPLSIVTAGDDRICDSGAAAKLAARAPRARCVEIPDAYHEILMETDARRQVFWRAFDAVADEVAPR
jgi:lysophospholipase